MPQKHVRFWSFGRPTAWLADTIFQQLEELNFLFAKNSYSTCIVQMWSHEKFSNLMYSSSSWTRPWKWTQGLTLKANYDLVPKQKQKKFRVRLGDSPGGNGLGAIVRGELTGGSYGGGVVWGGIVQGVIVLGGELLSWGQFAFGVVVQGVIVSGGGGGGAIIFLGAIVPGGICRGELSRAQLSGGEIVLIRIITSLKENVFLWSMP